MRNFQEKSKWKKFFQSPIALICLALFLLFFAWNILVFVGKMQDTARNKKLAEAKVVELKNEKEKLSSEIEKLGTTSGVEETIRDKFGLVKEGEDVIVIVNDHSATANPQESEGKGFFSFLRNLFK